MHTFCSRAARRLTGLMLVAAASSAGAADNDDEAAPGAHPLGTITVVANKVAEPLAEVAGTVSLIERERIDQILAADIKALVRYEPGVSVNEDSSRFGAQGFSIRGLDANRVVIEVDGVPITDGFSVGSFSRANRDLVDPELIERVEILRGPASTLYGSDALAGVVSFVTRDPQALLDQGNGHAYLGGHLRYASSDDSRLATTTAAFGSEGWRGLLSLSDRNANERENAPRPGGLKSNPAEVRDRFGLAKLAYDHERIGALQLIAEASRNRGRTDVQSLVGGPGQFATTTGLLADDLSKRERLSLHWQRDLRLGLFDHLNQRLYTQDTDFDQQTDQHRRGASPTAAATRRERGFRYRQGTVGGEWTLDGERRYGRLDHRVVGGVEWVQNRLSERRDGRETNLATGAVSTVIAGEVLPVRDFPNSTTTELGVFLQDSIGIGRRLTLTPGLRFEHYRVNARTDPLWLADNPDTPVVDVSEQRVTPKLGLSYQWSPALTSFVQVARGFRAPPFSDVNIGFDIPAFGFSAIPNPDLKSETSTGLEAGLRWTTATGSGALTVFDNFYHQLIESRVNLGTDPVSGLLIFQSQNRDRAEIYGVELSADLSLARWLGAGTRLNTAWSYARGTDTRRDLPLNTIDPAKAVIGIARESGDRRHRLELVGSFVARKRRLDQSRTPLFASPGFSSFDLFYSWQPADAVRVNLGVFNLSDRRHWLWGTVRGLTPNAREVDLATEPGRNVALSLHLGF
ncbi:MAG: TonB-dependent hemoglobin/transferrin/lactoferrin family receptor [Lysobacterales bacterium]